MISPKFDEYQEEEEELKKSKLLQREKKRSQVFKRGGNKWSQIAQRVQSTTYKVWFYKSGLYAHNFTIKILTNLI